MPRQPAPAAASHGNRNTLSLDTPTSLLTGTAADLPWDSGELLQLLALNCRHCPVPTTHFVLAQLSTRRLNLSPGTAAQEESRLGATWGWTLRWAAVAGGAMPLRGLSGGVALRGVGVACWWVWTEAPTGRGDEARGAVGGWAGAGEDVGEDSGICDPE
ncbi:hypothetical protein P7K49_003294 [Saguinus oedipus]|uniref:Uncharacterized protein n=1 Tax=Saguinus oedipus TaxID=9490 RepID=A0ABQ9WJR8_SAGOE|nr:hypothetical protein P7K49_003294 [Saguinus oedipus]